MEASETIDGLLASLMGMGFDQIDCQDAIKMGKLCLNDAVDWILSGKPKPSSSGHLVLNKNQDAPSSSVEMLNEAANQTYSSSKVEASQNLVKSEEDTSRAVLSRYAASRDDRSKIQDKKRRKLEEEIRKDKINKMKLRENVLKEIECDRKAQHKGKKESLEPKGKPSSSPQAKDTFSVPSSSCFVQIRLPNSSPVRHKFSSDQKVRDILDFLKNKISTDPQHQVILLQPFPRLELESEGSSSLEELGLCPSCSLVARVVPLVQPSTGPRDDENVTEPMNDPAGNHLPSLSQVQQALGHAPAGQRYSWVPPALPPSSSASHHWPSGEGHRLGYENDASVAIQNSSDVLAEEETLPEVSSQEGNPEEEEVARGTLSVDHHIWGSGRLLVDEEDDEGSPNMAQEVNESDDVHDDLQLRRDLAMHALEQRLEHAQRSPEVSSRPHMEQTVPSLFARSLNVLLQRIDSVGKDKLSTVGVLPLAMANRLLKELIERKKLDPNTVLLLRSCPLMKLKLDYYPYATNHLIDTCKVFRGLRVLSLRFCSLLTDKGMTLLESLHRLQYLDVSGCDQLTNNTLTYLKDCQEVSYLSLDGTRVSDAGLSNYLQRCGCRLVSLSLKNLPGISESSLVHDMPALQALYIDRTKVKKLEKLFAVAPNLQHLSLSGCCFLRDQLQYFCLLKDCLTSLNVTHMTVSHSDSSVPNGDVGDYVMQQLKDSTKLQKLDFSYRHSLTSVGMSCLETFPLSFLDLSHHRSVDDAALRHVASMRSLKRLDLTNTNITDDGLRSLTSLLTRLNELVLNKTPITGPGVIEMFAGMADHPSTLTVLSLQLTHVDNTLLRRQVLNHRAARLVTLNLRNTKVSDSGLRHLVLPHLTSLYLNDTNVRLRSRPEMYPGCPNLKHVRVNSNILMTSFQAESDSDDAVN